MSARGKLNNEEVAVAFLIGFGLLIMALAAGIGAAFSTVANEALYGLLFVLGLVAFIAGVVLWFVLVRPWEQFDDINVPRDSGHHSGHDDH